MVATGSITGANFLHELLEQGADADGFTLGYGQKANTPGLHLMHNGSSNHFVELVTGLGATGVEVIVAFVKSQAAQAHPLIPTLQVALDSANLQVFQRLTT